MEYISRDDELENIYILRKHVKGRMHNHETFIDKQLKRATTIVRRQVTRPQYSSETQEVIRELINELNRLDSAIKRHECN